MIDQQVGNSPREDRAPDMCTQMTSALDLHAWLLLSPVKQLCSHTPWVLPRVRTTPVPSSPSLCSSCSGHDPFEDKELRLCHRGKVRSDRETSRITKGTACLSPVLHGATLLPSRGGSVGGCAASRDFRARASWSRSRGAVRGHWEARHKPPF